VKPELFADQLSGILDEVPPLPGEEAWYAQIRSVVAAAEKEPRFKKVLTDAATSDEDDLVEPLFQFRNYGLPLAHNWTTQSNGAMLGIDYYTRTAVAKSNILVNKPHETKYFSQDLDSSGARLNGKNSYTVTFAKGPGAAGQGLLVAEALQRASLLPSTRTEAVLAGHQEQDAPVRSRWVADGLRLSDAAGCGTTLELAAIAGGRVLPLRAGVLA
jgi:hypothetical protein